MRRLLCIPCGHDYQLHPLDAVNGFKLRKVQGLARKPEAVGFLACDYCRDLLPDGAPAIAVTMWGGQEIGPWESEYLTPLPVEQS